VRVYRHLLENPVMGWAFFLLWKSLSASSAWISNTFILS